VNEGKTTYLIAFGRKDGGLSTRMTKGKGTVVTVQTWVEYKGVLLAWRALQAAKSAQDAAKEGLQSVRKKRRVVDDDNKDDDDEDADDKCFGDEDSEENDSDGIEDLQEQLKGSTFTSGIASMLTTVFGKVTTRRNKIQESW
jgi:hypothetical protein